MKKITNTMELKMAIVHLEEKQAAEGPLLKEQFLEMSENLKPLNILKNTFKEIISPDLKNDMLVTTIGLSASYLTKAIIVSGSHNPIKKLVGELLEVGILNIVSKNSDTIKLFVQNTASFFSKQKRKPEFDKD